MERWDQLGLPDSQGSQARTDDQGKGVVVVQTEGEGSSERPVQRATEALMDCQVYPVTKDTRETGGNQGLWDLLGL